MNSPAPIPNSCLLTVSFVVAGIAQTAWLHSGAWSILAKPIDGGRTFRGKRLFGDSKTWRGMVVMIPAVGASFMALGAARPRLSGWLQQGLWNLNPSSYLLVGFLVGAAFMLGELPNSFIKRQLGVASGQSPENPAARWFCFFLDQVDSIVAALLMLSLLVPVSPWTWLYLIAGGTVVHWLFNVVLYLLGVKERPA